MATLIYPYSIPFLEREPNWLEKFREIRIIKILREPKKKVSLSKEEKMMQDMFKLMTPEQMEGYLKGIKK